MPRHFWRSAAAIFTLSTLLAWLVLSQRHELRVNLSFATTAQGPGEIFYAEAGQGFAAGKSVTFPTFSNGALQKYRVDVASWKPIQKLRLDLATASGPIEVSTLEVRRKVFVMKTVRRAVPLEPTAYHHATPSTTRANGALSFESTGSDPFLEITLPAAVLADVEAAARKLQIVVALLCGLLVAMAATLLAGVRVVWARFAVGNPASAGAPAWLSSLAERLSDPAVLRFSPASVAVLLLSMVIACSGIVGKINLSSVGMWDQYLPSATTTDSTLLGQPRAIRADEWLVSTPWILSQAANGYPLENISLGGTRTPLVTSMPTGHPVSAFQPEFWGFGFLDIERAISWYWMFKAVGLFVSAFLLLLVLTRGDGFASLFGAIWVLCSSFTQWWFSTNLPELLTGFCLTVLGFLLICLGARRQTMLAGAVALVLGATTFAFQIYPPFQIPLAYLAAAIAVGVLASRSVREGFRSDGRTRLVVLALCTLLLAGLLFKFAIDAASTIGAVQATVYPGKRFSLGGSLPWWMVFDGIFEGWRHGEATFPWQGSNASESSDYVILFPLSLAMILLQARHLLRDGVVVALVAFCVLLAAWMVIPLPTAVEHAISRFMLMSYVPPPRAPVALGVASIFLVTICVSRLRGAVMGWTVLQVAFTFAAAFLAYVYAKLVLQPVDATFFTDGRALLGCALVALGSWAIARGSRWAFGAFVLALSLPGMTVNPISRGLGPLIDKPVLAAAVKASSEAPQTRWIVVGSFVVPQAFKAHGLSILGGATYLPDGETFRILDPANRYAEVWNRYAHIVVESDASLSDPEFVLAGQDLYRLRLDVCSPQVDALGINRVAYLGEAPMADLQCLKPLGAPVDGVSLYARDGTRGRVVR